MNIQKLNMPKLQAWNAYREYKVACGKSGDQRDRGLMIGYKALAKGNTVINLDQVMKMAGTFESGFPRLAIIRADFNECWCRRRKNGSASFCNQQSPWGRSCWEKNLKEGTYSQRNEDVFGKAIVPMIPPRFRPGKTMLKNYFILWEADWTLPPVDPILLKHLAGDLYAVVAEWNLTPLEQAVLR